MFFKQVKGGQCIYKDDHTIVVDMGEDKYGVIAWNHGTKRENKSLMIEYNLPVSEKEYCMIEKRVGEKDCNPLKMWHDLGEPRSLSRSQKKLLQEAAVPTLHSYCKEAVGKTLQFSVMLDEFDVVYLEILPRRLRSDRGYDYERVMQ